MTGMCPSEIERHLQLNKSKFIDFEDMRGELATYLETRIGAKLKIGPLGGKQPGADNMDVGAFGKDGHKGKKGVKRNGKQQKGKGKGNPKEKVSLVESAASQVEVWLKAGGRGLFQLRKA